MVNTKHSSRPVGVSVKSKSTVVFLENKLEPAKSPVVYIKIYIYAFSRRFYPVIYSGYNFVVVSKCVPWELNPRPFALLTQCSTTEPQEHTIWNGLSQILFYYLVYLKLLTVWVDTSFDDF